VSLRRLRRAERDSAQHVIRPRRYWFRRAGAMLLESELKQSCSKRVQSLSYTSSIQISFGYPFARLNETPHLGDKALKVYAPVSRLGLAMRRFAEIAKLTAEIKWIAVADATTLLHPFQIAHSFGIPPLQKAPAKVRSANRHFNVVKCYPEVRSIASDF